MEFRPRLNKYEYNLIRGEGNRVLVIGDLHEPFTRSSYLGFCKAMYKKYNCNKVVFIGDILDNHYSSFHDIDPDGHSAASELRRAKKNIRLWHKEFPNAIVTKGNHDEIPARKLFSAGVSKSWMRSMGEVLKTPSWDYVDSVIIDNVKYVHGTGRKARQRAKDDFMSIIQGHYHSESYIEFFVGEKYKYYAMQVGCGMDRQSYASAYGRHFKKMHINVGIVLNNGTLPILEYMKL